MNEPPKPAIQFDDYQISRRMGDVAHRAHQLHQHQITLRHAARAVLDEYSMARAAGYPPLEKMDWLREELESLQTLLLQEPPG